MLFKTGSASRPYAAAIVIVLALAGCVSKPAAVAVSAPQTSSPVPVVAVLAVAPEPVAAVAAARVAEVPAAGVSVAAVVPAAASSAAQTSSVTTVGAGSGRATRPASPARVPVAPAAAVTPNTVASAARPGPAAVPGAAPALDLEGLERRLRDTKAIGVFTKLALKNQVDDLLDAFRGHHRGRGTPPIGQLRQRYDLLLMKVLALLQDGDPMLAKAVHGSRESIWSVLVDPVRFSKL